MERITVKNKVKADARKVWKLWSEPSHIVRWNTPSDDWHTPHAENDLREGGQFVSRMEAKDGSFGFDFKGTYDEVIPEKRIVYTLEDGRIAETDFNEHSGETEIVTRFDPESVNPVDMQRDGWQAILDNFKKYAETS